MFTYNKIFYMRYSPKGIMKLPFFDQYPLILPLEISGYSMIAVNIHWIPVPLREKFLNVLIKIYELYPNKKAFRIWYKSFKSNPALSFALVGLRRYLISRCSNIKEIPPEVWYDLPDVWDKKYQARYFKKIVS